jgi:pyruvate formate lyase activating enzyme
MEIKGLIKTTLIDYPGKVACTVFLYGCNFRCGFCHNPELVLSELAPPGVPSEEGKLYSEEEILGFLVKRKGQLDAVCITGGEPLISLDKDFLKEIKGLGFLIKIDTNGSYPEKLKELIDEELVDYVAMDIKASKEKYEEVVRAKIELDKIEETIKLISKLPNYEFRTTIVEEGAAPLGGVPPIAGLGGKEFKKMIAWLVELGEGKIKRFALQGFKKEEKMLDEKFKSVNDTKKEYLEELKKIAEEFCDEVVVRV